MIAEFVRCCCCTRYHYFAFVASMMVESQISGSRRPECLLSCG